MSDGRAWAAEQEEREEALRSLGLCVYCAKRTCDCETEYQIEEMNKHIANLKENIEYDRSRIRYYQKTIKELKTFLKPKKGKRK